ncbi:MAG TPA: hypothetical protein GXZ65_05430 [Clostridiales bacterium]|jgi:hypothetical protein|nr:hypothetical protein [Clostridiales bacterium]
MSACTFFGHRDCPSSIKSKLRKVLIDLIESHAVDMFYVGQQGSFDSMVRSVLKELVSLYPHINYAVVLERIPPKRDEFDIRDYSDTMLPEGIETVHPRFAISWRNKWMIKQSDYVVTYITHSWGGAAQFAEKAVRQSKIVINLHNYVESNNL